MVATAHMEITIKMEKAKRVEEQLSKLLWDNMKLEGYELLVREIETFLRSKNV